MADIINQNSVKGPAIGDGNFLIAPDRRSAYLVIRDGYRATTVTGPRRVASNPSLEDVDSLVRWAQRNIEVQETGEILVGATKITVDPDPTDVDADRAVMPLVHHFRLQRWLNVLGKWLSPLDLRRLLLASIEDTEPIYAEERKPGSTETTKKIVGYEGSIMAQSLQAMKVSRKGEVVYETNEFGAIVAQGKVGSTTIDVKLKPTFVLRVPVFIGALSAADREKRSKIEVRIEMNVEESGAVAFALSAPGLQDAILEARANLVESIRARLGEASKVYVGMGERGVREYIGEIPRPVEVFFERMCDPDLLEVPEEVDVAPSPEA
jgi:hypothetical protein